MSTEQPERRPRPATYSLHIFPPGRHDEALYVSSSTSPPIVPRAGDFLDPNCFEHWHGDGVLRVLGVEHVVLLESAPSQHVNVHTTAATWQEYAETLGLSL